MKTMLAWVWTNKATLLKSSAGVALLGVAAWLTCDRMIWKRARDAMVGAAVVRVRSPIDGRVTLAALLDGQVVAKDAAIAKIENPLVDDRDQKALSTELASIEAEITSLKDVGVKLASVEGSFATNARAYREKRISQLKTQLKAAESHLASAETRLRGAEQERLRAERLVVEAVASQMSLEELTRAVDVARSGYDVSRAQLDELKLALAAAQQGLFVDSGNYGAEVSYSEQRGDMLRMNTLERQARLHALERRRGAVESQLAAQERKLALHASQELKSNAQGRVWRVLARDAQWVHEGEDVVELLDCGSLVITGAVPRRVFERLSLGEPAEFSPRGSDERHRGRVVALLGPMGSGPWDQMVIAPTVWGDNFRNSTDAWRVVVKLDAGRVEGCPIGLIGDIDFG